MANRYAIVIGTTPIEIFPGKPFIDNQGNQHPRNWMDGYDEVDLNNIGILPITPGAAPPTGQVVVGSTLSLIAGVPVEQLSYGSTPVPDEISMLDAQIVLARHGYLDGINTMMSSANSETKIYWNRTPTIHRQHPLVLSIGAAIPLTSDQIDALFIEAATVTS
jgi:hypothetical protein